MIVNIVDAKTIELQPEDALEDDLLRSLAAAEIELVEPEPLAQNIVKLRVKQAEEGP